MTRLKRVGQLIGMWLLDSLLLELALFFSLALRLDLLTEASIAEFTIPLVCAGLLIPFLYGILYLSFGAHRVIWQYSNLRDVLRICLLVGVSVVLLLGVLLYALLSFLAWKKSLRLFEKLDL